MIVEVKVPEIGESITEGILVEWYKETGDLVAVEDTLYELETDKVTMSIAAEIAGQVTVQVAAGERVKVGQVVATITTDVAAGVPQPPDATALPIAPPAGLAQARAKLADAALHELAPAVRRFVAEHALDPASIPASGKGGRITKEDAIRYLESFQRQQAPPEAPVAPPPPAGERARTRVAMTALRSRIAERLLQATNQAAMLTTFNEVDLSGVMAWRDKHKASFEKAHGARLGFMSFFVKAAVDALKRFPVVSAQIEGDEIVYHHYQDVGVAVGTEQGLVVPVLRDVDQMSFADIEEGITALAERARDRKLQLSDLTGGTFSITNGGVYGSLMSTPILNPPQSAILGMHGIKRRPIAVGDEVVIRPMMYLALSYDHRIVDGKDAVSFLKRIVDVLEAPERLVLDV